ncbi:MAG: hypothetical protein PHF56_19285 [Desulfuromonadaceae bacterium]|nr:hypothetical protein [Desulfuromonadaceae bacterium]
MQRNILAGVILLLITGSAVVAERPVAPNDIALLPHLRGITKK